ncbi:MAG: hypothetical protein JNK11_06575, partial [Alphaproteobacteria bacterium]|nr:hypothetical protein [Alphaproteobacteria bacterium]
GDQSARRNEATTSFEISPLIAKTGGFVIGRVARLVVTVFTESASTDGRSTPRPPDGHSEACTAIAVAAGIDYERGDKLTILRGQFPPVGYQYQ